MVEGGQKWSERLGVCDPRVRRAPLFICMVVRLCWYFSNFSWLCKVFLQTSLHFASQFRNSKAISTFGGDFAAISKLGDHFAGNGQFRSPFRSLEIISQPNGNFAEEGDFRSPFRSCEMGVWGYEMALVCQGSVSQGVAMGLL